MNPAMCFQLLRVLFLTLLTGFVLMHISDSSSAAEGIAAPVTSTPLPGSASCARAYRDVVRGMACPGLFDFQKNCRGDLNNAMVTTALRMRCADEMVERKINTLQEEFAKLGPQSNCAAVTAFVDRYATDYDVVDVPELEKGNTLRIKVCEQEIRAKEMAAIEASLREVTTRNDCSAFQDFEKKYSTKLSPDQVNRLAQSTTQRCDFEQQVKTTLKKCLEKNEADGNFCGGTACYRSFRDALPDSYFAPYRADSQRQENICKESANMRSCFSSDACGGERCSLPLRLAIGAGPLLTQVERSEKDVLLACTAKRQREENERLEEERRAERRREEARAQTRRDNTIKLTICNHSAQSKIYVALNYFDYDENDWVIQGWWNIDRGECTYAGDRFKRGTIYYYANGPGEKWVWKGDFGLCVEWSRFRQTHTGRRCDRSKFRLFRHREIYDNEYSLEFT